MAVPWWQLPTPFPAPIVIVRDVTHPEPPVWTYFIPGVAALLTIAGVYFAAARQAKGTLDAAIEAGRTQLAVAEKNSKATFDAAVATINAGRRAQRAVERAARKRDENTQRRMNRAVHRRIVMLLESSAQTIYAEALIPIPVGERAQRERERTVGQFIDFAYTPEVAMAHDDQSLSAIYYAASMAQGGLYSMTELLSVTERPERAILDRATVRYAGIVEGLCDSLEALGETAKANVGREKIAAIKASRPALWQDNKDDGGRDGNAGTTK
jgi:hypothetical protein